MSGDERTHVKDYTTISLLAFSALLVILFEFVELLFCVDIFPKGVAKVCEECVVRSRRNSKQFFKHSTKDSLKHVLSTCKH